MKKNMFIYVYVGYSNLNTLLAIWARNVKTLNPISNLDLYKKYNLLNRFIKKYIYCSKKKSKQHCHIAVYISFVKLLWKALHENNQSIYLQQHKLTTNTPPPKSNNKNRIWSYVTCSHKRGLKSLWLTRATGIRSEGQSLCPPLLDRRFPERGLLVGATTSYRHQKWGTIIVSSSTWLSSSKLYVV